MRDRLAACLWLVSGTAFITAQTPTVKPIISPVRAIFVQDQRDRGVHLADNGDDLKPTDAGLRDKQLPWDEIAKRDEERRKQVNVLLANGEVKTAQDYEDAAFVFQHGQAPDDFLLAHILAMEAVVLGDTKAKWIAAATLDRYLQTIGQKQVFGTQYGNTQYAYYLQHKADADVLQKFKTIPLATTQEPYNSKLLPGSMRKDFCVPDLSLQQKYVDDTNAGKKADIPRMPECRR